MRAACVGADVVGRQETGKPGIGACLLPELAVDAHHRLQTVRHALGDGPHAGTHISQIVHGIGVGSFLPGGRVQHDIRCRVGRELDVHPRGPEFGDVVDRDAVSPGVHCARVMYGPLDNKMSAASKFATVLAIHRWGPSTSRPIFFRGFRARC